MSFFQCSKCGGTFAPHHTYCPSCDALNVELLNATNGLRDDLRAMTQPKAPEDCPACKGSGESKGYDTTRGPDVEEFDIPCPKCGGTGEAPEGGAVEQEDTAAIIQEFWMKAVATDSAALRLVQHARSLAARLAEAESMLDASQLASTNWKQRALAAESSLSQERADAERMRKRYEYLRKIY